MRFVSQYPGYKFQARPQRTRSLGDGGVEITQEGIYCQFLAVGEGAMIYENEIAAALKAFEFRGNTQHEDEATPSDPMLRLSIYDTDEMAQVNHWDDATKAFVEERLVWNSQTSPSECLLVMDTPIAPPFPAYDEWDGPDVERLIVKLIEDGHDLPLVLHYERTFGKRRPQIIEALEEEIEKQKESIVAA
jgi:hypothetical protein